MYNLFRIPGMLAWQDIRQAYRRSAIGPFWLTIGMAVQIVTMGLVFGLIFKTELSEYLPFLATSLVLWGLISTSTNEGCMAFISSEAMVKQLNLPHYQYVIRTVWRNLVSAGHNFAILPLLLLFFWQFPGWTLISFIPGLVILVLNIGWVVWLLGMMSARFRDMPPIVSSVMTIAFYVTPVMWYPQLIENNALAHLLLGLNPLYHWLQIVRLPIMGQWPTWENWGLGRYRLGCHFGRIQEVSKHDCILGLKAWLTLHSTKCQLSFQSSTRQDVHLLQAF
jgi:ABC-type polysaccharide/polyol phosphate export permease